MTGQRVSQRTTGLAWGKAARDNLKLCPPEHTHKPQGTAKVASTINAMAEHLCPCELDAVANSAASPTLLQWIVCAPYLLVSPLQSSGKAHVIAGA